MTAEALAQPLPRAGTRSSGAVAAVAALAGAVAVLAAVGLLQLLGGSHLAAAPSPRVYTAPDRSFVLAVPAGWSAVRSASTGGSRPLALIRRGDGHGVVIVTRTGPVRGDLRAMAAGLTRELRRRLPGFSPVSARIGTLRGGKAFVYTFVRDRSGAVQSLALTSARGSTYRIDSIVRAGDRRAASEAGAITGSFGP